MKLTDSQIISLLGGINEVASLCKVSIPAVHHWKTRGIPALQLMFLGALLEKKSHGLITRKDLFPESWHLVWPEIVEKKSI